jgi:hypothetical protein
MAEPMGPEPSATPDGEQTLVLIINWLWVGLPLAWGVWETVRTSMQLFR